MTLAFPPNPAVGLIYLNWRWDGAKWARMPAAAAGVASFNTRSGAVTLLSTDITAAGGALLAGPTFTGVPKAPTATAGTNTTQLATTAFVSAAVTASTTGVASFNTRTGAVVLSGADISAAGGALLSSPIFTGSPAAPTPTAGDNSTKLATTAFVAANFASVASPALTGNPTAPTQAPGDNDTSIATTAFVTGGIATAIAPLAPTSSIPTASTTTPIMDGTAAVGGGTTWARADHVHPTDTSRAPLASPTFTGAVTLPADPAANLQAATKQYVDAGDALALPRSSYQGGFVNKLRNGTFDVWQRGAGNITIGANNTAYTVDGWLCSATGAAATVGQGGAIGRSLYSAIITGAAGLTSCNFIQFVESSIAAPLAGQTCTFQMRILNTSGATLTLQLATFVPNATDNFAVVTADLPVTNLQSIASGATATVAYTFNVSANATRGYGVYLVFGGQLNGAGKWAAVSDADFRATPGLPAGLCANPPPSELRPISQEMVFCQRYFETSFGNGVAPGTITPNGSEFLYVGGVTNQANVIGMGGRFKSAKRGTPSIVVYGVLTGTTAGQMTINGVNVAATVANQGVTGFACYATGPVGSVYNASFQWTASAEL